VKKHSPTRRLCASHWSSQSEYGDADATTGEHDPYYEGLSYLVDVPSSCLMLVCGVGVEDRREWNRDDTASAFAVAPQLLARIERSEEGV
jgi:hypothetical protein